MLRYCQRQTPRWTGTAEDARDAAQEAALRAWRMRHQCATPEAPWGWLATICQREAHRLLARRRETPIASPEAFEAGTHDLDAAPDLEVRAAVADLPPLDRALISLRYGHDQTHARIAELVGLPEGTVKVRLHRARSRLRERLDR